MRFNAGFAYASYSGQGGLNGGGPSEPPLLSQSSIMHASGRYLWLEENDSRGENKGSWLMDRSTPGFVDSAAVWHGNTSTFSWADGHAESHRWADGAFINYNASTDPLKYNNPPAPTSSPTDLSFLSQGYASVNNP